MSKLRAIMDNASHPNYDIVVESGAHSVLGLSTYGFTRGVRRGPSCQWPLDYNASQ